MLFFMTGMTLSVSVMTALYIRIVIQSACQIIADRYICQTRNSAKQLYSGLGKCHLRTASNAAADQNINARLRQESGKSSVSLPVGIHHPAADDLSILCIIKLKLFRMAKMLKDHTILISYCDSHPSSSPYL